MKTLLTYALTALLLLTMSSSSAYAQNIVSEVFSQHIEADAISSADASLQPLGIRYTKKHPLIIVSDWSFPPYSFSDDDGEPDGYQIDVIRALFDRLHIPYEIRTMEWHMAKDMVNSGKAHLMMDIMKNDENYRVCYGKKDFCPYEVGIAYSAKSHSVQRLSDLQPTDTVFMTPGDYADDYIMHRSTKPVFHIKYLDKDEMCEELLKGSNKYYIWGYRALQTLVRSYYFRNDLIVNQLTDFPAGHFRFYSHDKQLLGELDQLYDQLERSETITNLNEDWFNPEAENDDYLSKNKTIVAILVIILVIILLVFSLILVIRRGALIGELRREYSFITDMALEICDCYLIAIDLKTYRAYNIYGNLLPEEGVSYEEYERLIHPDDILIENEARRQVDDGATEMPPVTFRMRHHGRGGEYRTVVCDVRTNYDNAGKLSLLYISMRDATELLKEQETLMEYVEEYEQMFEKAEVGLAIYGLDGSFIQWNKAMEQIFIPEDNSLIQETIQNTKLFDLPLLRNEIDPADPEAFFVCSNVIIPELNCHHYLEYRIRYIRDEEGKPICYAAICAIRDEERKAAKECQKLKEDIAAMQKNIEVVKGQMNYVMEKSKITPFIYDLSTDWIAFAPDRMHFDMIQPLQPYIDSLICDEHDEDVTTTPVDGITQCAKPYHAVRKVKALCGQEYDSPHWFSVNSIPINDKDGTVSGSFGLVKDVTDFILMQKKLREESAKALDSAHSKSLFLAGMTHELRTPLNAISGFADVVGSMDDGKEKAECVEIMRQNCQQLIRLIDNIILLSRIDTHGLQPISQQLDFPEAFRKECQRLFSAYPLQEGVEYVLDTPDIPQSLSLDFVHIMQIMEQFISNASKFTSHGTVKVGYSLSDGLLTFYCEDTGIGIAKADQSHVFDRFFKVDNFIPGTGLGLSVCKAIADYIGGKIEVRSEEGVGSRFSLSLLGNR